MEHTSSPLTLRLPHSFRGGARAIARLLACGHCQRPWSVAFSLAHRFELAAPERRFVRSLLSRRTNYWLFRCDQRAFCGDFVAVDMSAPRPDARLALVIELKQRMPLRVGRWARSVQLANHPCALAEIAATTGVVTLAPRVRTVVGDPDAVLAGLP